MSLIPNAIRLRTARVLRYRRYIQDQDEMQYVTWQLAISAVNKLCLCKVQSDAAPTALQNLGAVYHYS